MHGFIGVRAVYSPMSVSPSRPSAMHTSAPFRFLPAVVLFALISACGGGGGDNPTKPGGNGGGSGGGGTTPLVAPANLSVVTQGLDRITLAWQDNSADETGFELERTPSASANWVRVQTLAPNTVTATDSGLATGTAVRYRVRAVKGAEQSAYAAEVSARTTDAPITLLAPTNVVATALSSTRVQLKWVDASNDEDGFEIQRSAGTDTAWVSMHQTSANAMVWMDSTLSENSLHRYRVRATQGAVRSTFTVSDTVRTHPKPADLIATLESVVTSVMPPGNTPAANRNPRQELRALRDRLRTIPAVATTLLDTLGLSLQAITTEGLSVVFMNNTPPDEGLGAAASRSALTMLPPTPSPLVANSAQAVVTSFGGGDELATEVRGLLGRAGYTISPLGASVSDMRNYKNLGALYLDTHGVSFQRVNGLKKDSNGKIIGWDLDGSRTYFALETSTKVNVSALTAYDAELKAGDLLVSVSQAANGKWQTQLAITERFIQKYWTFKDGVAVIHSCFAGAQPFGINVECNGACDLSSPSTLDPTVLRSAMLGAGASLVMSFDNYTWASYAAPSVRMFFDRMLGVNQIATLTPGNRPFGSGPVITQLQEKGLDKFRKPHYTLFSVGFGGDDVNVTFDGNTTDALLAPSVRAVDVVDDAAAKTSRFELFGNFGNKSGRLELNGSPLTIQSWADNKVVATAPITEPGFGELQLFPPDGVGSNKVPVTEWQTTVTITSEIGTGTLRAEAKLDMRFRADVRGFRTRVDGPVEKPEITTTLEPQSSGTVRGSGRQDDVTFTGSEQVNWFARDVMVRGGEGPSTTTKAGATLVLKPKTGRGELCLLVYGFTTAVGENGLSIRQLTIFSGPVGFPGTKGIMGCLDLSMSENFAMPGGSRVLFQEDNHIQRITWTPLVPVQAPTGTTSR